MLPDNSYARMSFHFTGVPVPRGADVVLCFRRFDEAPWVVQDADDCFGAFTESFMPLLDGDVACNSATVKEGPDDTGASYDVGFFNGGGEVGASAPPNVAFLLTKRTLSGGRRSRGRMYLPGVIESAVSQSGTLEATWADSLAGAGNSFLGLLQSSFTNAKDLVLEHFDETTWQLVGGQPRRVPVPNTAPDPSVVIGITCSDRVATQRRRLRG